mmetsp:Transcript_1244/g.3532  ORF Transcript_1244/g.3532 Transcript_1244/m.3532 type:complete len:285 (+) Transcript_1244:3291-4145(+)
MEPPSRCLPWPRSIRMAQESSRCHSGVSVPRTSAMLANADTISDTGAVTCWSSHLVRIDSESLPTGMDTPSAGHSSMPTALTVSNSAASSPGSPQAAIQLALSFTRGSSIGAASRLVMASATAMRPDAGAFTDASGMRSPMLIASPAKPWKSASVTAQSATGTCQGPTIWSRWFRPPTVRSPMVTRKRLLATVGWRSTSKAACSSLTPVRSRVLPSRATRVTLRWVLGGLPSSTSIGMSIGNSSPSASLSSRASVATPMTANGQRSRSQKDLNSSRLSGAIAST